MLNDETPCIAEQYSTATTSSNLRVEADKRSSADILIASGLSNSRMGAACMRLLTEFGSAASNRTDQKLMLMRLKSLTTVVEQVKQQAIHWRMVDADALALSVVAHWLDSSCKACHRLGFERVPGSPALSNRMCKACKGLRDQPIPGGQAGTRLQAYMGDCISRWRQATAKKLHGMR